MGSVVRTGMKVAWAFRGFNPHHRKDPSYPSYYPLVAHLAQTGHILRLKNRPGNVHDSKQAVPFLCELIDSLRAQFGRRVVLEFRMDAAFFQRGIFPLLTARDCLYAIKVGYWNWLPLKQLAAACPQWHPVAPGVTGYETELPGPQWNLPAAGNALPQARAAPDPPELPARSLHPRRWALRVLPWRPTCPWGSPALWAFAAGAGRSPARGSGPYAFLFRSMRTLRFLILARAGRVTRIDGRNVLRLADNSATQALYERIAHALAA